MSSILERDVLDALSYMTLHRLVNEISIENANPARDWRGFADLVGFSARHIRTIDQQVAMAKAMKVLEVWDQTGKSSLRKLILALNVLGLVSSLDVLKEDRDIQENGVDFSVLAAEAAELRRDMRRLQELFPRLTDSEVLPPLLSLHCEDSHHIPPMPGTMHSCSQQKVPSLEPSIVHNTVYISYCPEANRRFKRQIKDLAQLLRRQRYTVFYDEFYTKREIRRYGGLDCWKERCILEAENILVVCTPQYFDEDCMLSNPDLRQRITKSPLEVDCKLLRTVAYGRSSERLIPIILDRDRPQARSCLPIWMFSPPLFWPSDHNRLIRCIEGIPEYTIPEPRERIEIKPQIIDFPEAYKHNPRDMQ